VKDPLQIEIVPTKSMASCGFVAKERHEQEWETTAKSPKIDQPSDLGQSFKNRRS
jgi:hypothetical protein